MAEPSVDEQILGEVCGSPMGHYVWKLLTCFFGLGVIFQFMKPNGDNISTSKAYPALLLMLHSMNRT